MLVRLGLMVLAAIACSATTPTPSPTPALTLSPTPAPSLEPTAAAVHPPICGDSNLVYDTHAQRLLLVTCVNQLNPVDHEQIWSWDGHAWSLVSDEGPPPLVVTSSAWDSDRNVLVRYGGLPLSSNECVPATWEWDGTDWAQRTTATDPHPPACDHMKLAYDMAHDMTVLVGGGKLQELSPETWAWDGENWTPLADENFPSPRAHHGFVYDPRLE
jgi:hypothetical protein